MNKLSLVRLGTYATIVVIAVMMRRQIGVIPLHALGEEDEEILRSEPERQKSDNILVRSVAFQDSKLSGSSVLAIARKSATEHGQNLSNFLPPCIALRGQSGRLLWVVSYRAVYLPGQFEIRIDDASGSASYEDTSAPL
jgi:hypothetical protein